MVSAMIRDDPVTDNRQKVGKIFPGTRGDLRWRAPSARQAWRHAAPACGLRSTPSRTGASSSRDCISAIAGARPAAPGSCSAATSAASIARTKLGLADDLQDANGDGAIDFSQAQRAARAGCVQQQRLACGLGPLAPTEPYTVARAMADYLEDYRRRGGKAADSIESVARQNILGPLGEFEVGKLTTKPHVAPEKSRSRRRRWRLGDHRPGRAWS